MSKLLIFLLLVIAAYLLLWKKRPAAESRQQAPASPEVMVSCAYCGLHVPLTESLKAGDRHYCGEEHRRLDGGDHGD
ncbi:MAG TPA: PP0621 family protein [Rhodocyclaceae bacterium]|nr:PP0621 family protein [Rhodocyclaceae bacterium]